MKSINFGALNGCSFNPKKCFDMNITEVASVRAKPTENALFSIIIPSWNNLPFLQLCIESIRKNSSFTHELIVHVNEGNDGTIEWLEQQGDISYTHSLQNIGVCYAMNAAVSMATTDYILYINDDMYVCPKWDEPLWEEVQKMPDSFYYISATAIEAHPQSNCSIRGDYGNHPNNFREEALLAEFNTLPMEDWQGATWPPCIVHKKMWDWVGGYSIEFSPGMYSDPDFSMKLWKAGVRWFKGVAASRVYHFGSVSTKKVRKNNGYYQFIAKWGMSSSTFSRYYINRGAAFMGALKTPEIPFKVNVKNALKRWGLVFRSTK